MAKILRSSHSQQSKKPGFRKNADEIIAAVTFWNLIVVFCSGAIGAIVLIFTREMQDFWWFCVGVGIVCVTSIISWLTDLLLARYFVNCQKYFLPAGYFLKIIFLFAVIWVNTVMGEPSKGFLILGFVLAIFATLVATSVVIMREDGPDFDRIAS